MMAKVFNRAVTTAALAACIAALTPGAIALAGYQEGGYTGVTEQSEAIAFRVANDRVKKLTAVVYAECQDGTRQRITVENGRTKVEQGRFTLELEGESKLSVSVSAKLRDNQSAGRIKAAVFAAGGTLCEVDTRWQATLDAAP